MQTWKDILNRYPAIDDIYQAGTAAIVSDSAAADFFNLYGIYAHSIEKLETALFFVAREYTDNTVQKALIIIGSSPANSAFEGCAETICGIDTLRCTFSHKNASALRKYFPYTAPICLRSKKITIGLGDRLGLASAGHIRLIRNYDVSPVLAQQSIRELNLTGRTYENVLDDVSFAVFQEGYKNGYGADGDHLKTAEEVKMALDTGFTMLTLDCSEHIDNSVAALDEDAIHERYIALPQIVKDNFEQKYLGIQKAGVHCFDLSLPVLQKIVLTYNKAIDFAENIYKSFFQEDGDVVFELSIDETLTPTDPEAHFIVAAELLDRGVRIDNLAPRFCGEFQKGIDYIGKIDQFLNEFRIHCAIADHFGYKISVHSGSDKFAVFKIVGEETHGRYHLKTAGTNWLEAVRTVAQVNPGLYRKMHAFALANIDEAKKYYHISAQANQIPDIENMADDELPSLMDQVDARQFLHITYGLILNAGQREDYCKDFYATLNTHESNYYSSLILHIGKHLDTLGVPKITP